MVITDLTKEVEFDVPFTVNADGTVITTPDAPWHPEVLDGSVEEGRFRWEPLKGYSGQYGTTPEDFILHDSEYLGGALARDILAEPGIYVCVAAGWSPDDWTEEPSLYAGWAVLRYEGESHPHEPQTSNVPSLW